MKVLLAAINSQYIHSNLAVRYLKAFTKDLDYDCAILEFTINDRIENILRKIIHHKPNIVAFSCYIWNIEYVVKLSKLIKIIDKDIEIVFGGPEVSYDGYSFLKENDGEYVIEGEGELTFRELIEFKINEYKNFQTNNINVVDVNIIEEGLKKIKGLYFKTSNDVKYTGPRENIDMNNVVFPYDEEDDLQNKIVYYEASRGCPFNCKYCLSSTIRNVRFRDIETVKKELKFLMDKNVKLIKFVDRTFNANIKFAMEIWKFLIEQDTQTKFHFEISANLFKKEEIELLSKAPYGRFQFEVGVQTTNNEVLSNINRKVDFDDISEKVVEIKKLNNIKQHLDLIAGLPGENFNSFVKSFNDIYRIKPEEIQLGFLKLLKGSPMRNEAKKWGMSFSPYPPYEILKTKHITYNELVILKRVEKMVDKYYNTQKFNNIISYFEEKFDSPFEFYRKLSEYFEYRGYFDRSLSSTEYYRVFIDFNEAVIGEESNALKEIIKFDYLLHNKKKWVPEFLNRNSDKNVMKEIKKLIRNSGTEFNMDNFHIEKFNIDISNYLKNREIILKDFYILFDKNNDDKFYELAKIVDLTRIF
ncbi:tRNA-2-methylthio-N(6)-dimethylallyladenosine synthase [Clostridium tepidiprofundi DSM 19306]|uniref:tRNA-2-methylthio-N(6)-dimethylallyladenosine synthase n=1 Tax=Clostridium tepidiprofundi DSM 19306 TaxID=1121338 RepID=A0A151B551_9CLOT|nr:B12-binding domain-containing radical SAM protein [Clostridium tepidiprofundi]KYH35016.1 tRNA-2-methylthio-N(6)-dimethylallyladenosine synthase [Clostridium tepidiprofundi DSM 19306]